MNASKLRRPVLVIAAALAVTSCDSATEGLIVNRCDVMIDVSISTDEFPGDVIEIDAGRAERSAVSPDSGELFLFVRDRPANAAGDDLLWHVDRRPIDPRDGYIEADRDGSSFWIFLVEGDLCPPPTD